MEMKDETFEPTGNWECRRVWNSNYETFSPCLVRPDGTIEAIYEPGWECQVKDEAATYNLNADKSQTFRICPYCGPGKPLGSCSWCS